MTTCEQELTLFGGWAVARIQPPIASGVPSDSVIASALHATRPSEGRLCGIGLWRKVDEVRWWLWQWESVHLWPDVWWRETPVTDWAPWTRRWQRLVLLRYLEIWGAVTPEKLWRALGVAQPSAKMSASLGGLLGRQNGDGTIRRTSAGWVAIDLDAIAQSWQLPRFPAEGIARARAVAHEQAARRAEQ